MYGPYRGDSLNAADALARTMLLMRTNLRAEASDAALLDALASVKVVLVADAQNLASHDGQHAFVAATLLIARSGGKCFLKAPNVRLGAVHAPLEQTHLLDALLDIGRDLIPDQEIAVNDQIREPDLAVILGDTPYSGSAPQVTRLSGDAWEGRLGPTGSRWISNSSPFGALAAAG